MPDYKLVATDMDGTLFNSQGEISEENIKAITDIQKKGVKFVLASGRPSFAMFEGAEKLEMKKWGGYILAANGGEIIDFSSNEVIFKEILKWEDIKTIYNTSKELGIPMVIYSGDTVYGSEMSTKFEADECKMKFVKFDSLQFLEESGINETPKCMFIDEPDKILKADAYMQEKYGKDYFIATSKPVFLEIVNKNVNKGKSLLRLGEILKIKPEEMIAIGDGRNDIPMLKSVGMPVAVANASSELKEISKFVSSSNDESALKTMIEKFY